MGMRSFCTLMTLALGTLGLADTLYLKDGRVVGGTYLGGSAREVRMDLGNQVATYEVADVAKIEFQAAVAAAPPPPPASPRRREETRERPGVLRPDPPPPA